MNSKTVLITKRGYEERKAFAYGDLHPWRSAIKLANLG